MQTTVAEKFAVREQRHPLLRRCADAVRSLTALVFRRLGGRMAQAEGRLAVEERLSLGPKKSLFLVNCCGQRVLVAVAGESVSALMEVHTGNQAMETVAKRRRRKVPEESVSR